VSKPGTGGGTVTSSPAGISCGADCSQDYLEGTEVVLTAAADAPGSSFEGWSGCDSSAGNQCTVTLAADRTVVAEFVAQRRTVEVATAGTGSGTVTSAPGPIDCGSVCSADYVAGTLVTLTAHPAAGSRFAGWSGDCAGLGACELGTTEHSSVTAVFSTLPPAAPECWDDLDNDGNGVSDYPGDRGCSSLFDDQESGFSNAFPPLDGSDGRPAAPARGVARVVRRVAPIRGRAALVRARCRSAACVGTARLVARVRVRRGGRVRTRNLVIGRGRYSIAAGEAGTIRILLNRRGRLLLRRTARRERPAVKATVAGSRLRNRTIRLRHRTG
jgi:hypothetical protein